MLPLEVDTALSILKCLWSENWLLLIWKAFQIKRKKIFQKGKCHSSLLWEAFQLSRNYCSLHWHFKLASQEERNDTGGSKIFHLLISGCDSCKSNQQETEMPQIAYLLRVQAKFPTNLFLNHRKQYFAKKYSIKALQQLNTMHFNCTTSKQWLAFNFRD